MHNPWQHNQVPDDGAVRRSHQWVKIVGALMWLAILATAGVLVFTDIGGERATAATVQVLQLTTATVVICIIGWIVQKVLRRLELLDGTLVNVFSMLFVFALPILVGLVAHQMGFLGGVASTELSNELSKVAPVDQWQREVNRKAVGPVKDVLPWG